MGLGYALVQLSNEPDRDGLLVAFRDWFESLDAMNFKLYQIKNGWIIVRNAFSLLLVFVIKGTLVCQKQQN